MNIFFDQSKKYLFGVILSLVSLPAFGEICLPELGNGNICTAKDFRLVDGLVSGPSSCTEGEIIPGGIVISLGMEPTANERYDIGIFVGDEDQSPVGGASCTFSSLTPLESGGDFDPTSGFGPYRNLDGNACGDTRKTDGYVYRTIPLNNVLCQDLNGDGRLDVSFVMTWQQNQGVCSDPNDPNNFISGSSKCVEWVGDIDEIEVTPPVPPPLPSIDVSKSAFPLVIHAPGGEVVYSINIENDGAVPVTLNSLLDNQFGDLNGKGTCAVPQQIEVEDGYYCVFAEQINGNNGDTHTNIVTASATDENSNSVTGSNSATVSIMDGNNGAIGQLVWHDVNGDGLATPDEPGIDGITIDLLQNGSVFMTTTTAQGGSYRFDDLPAGDYRVEVTDMASILANSILTGGIEPHDTTLSAGDIYLLANFGYALASIEVLKSQDKHVIQAPGELVTYTVSVQNTGPVDVTLIELTDDKFGDLNGKGSCSTPQLIVPGRIYSCGFAEQISGVPNELHQNTVTASAIDGADNSMFSADGALVAIIDARNGAIGDFVWYDQNLDGIWNEGEPGWDNVTLELWKDTTDDGDFDTLVDTTTTLYSGRYSFVNLAAGSYQVVVSDTHGILDGLILSGGIEPHQVVLASGEIIDWVDFGYGKPPIPLVSVVKRAAVSSVHAPGADVSYGVAVKNTGETSLTLSSLMDSKFGDLNGVGSCSVPQSIAIGELYFCAFSKFVGGEAGDIHTNVAFAIANDNAGNVVHDHDDASVNIIDSNDAAIGYLIWNDENADGIPDAGEAGLANVTLDLLQDQDDDGSFETTVATLTSNAGGVYAFTGLAAGSYRVAVTDTNSILGGMMLTGGVDPHDIALGVGQVYTAANFGYSRGSIKVIKVGDKSVIHAPGEQVAYTVTVQNTSTLELVLDLLTDDKFGDLTLRGCQLPQTLLALSQYSCSFSAALTGNVGDLHTNTITAVASDPAGNQATDSDNFTVTFVDSFSGAIGDTVWFDANRDGIRDPQESGLVSVSLELWQDTDTNGSYETPLGERVTDADGEYVFNNLGQGRYRVTVTDRFGVVTGMNLTGGVQPHDLNLAIAQVYMDADFGYSNPPLPAMLVVKNANVSSIHAPGDDVTYTVSVQNIGETAINLTSLTDNKFGDLNGQGNCQLPQSIALGGMYDCSFTANVAGNVGDVHVNEVLGSASDGLGGTIHGVDIAEVQIIDSEDAAIGYRVWFDGNADGVMDPGEVGLDNITLTLLQDTDNDGSYETTRATTATAAGGVYVFAQLPMGSYRVIVSDMNNLLDGMVMTGGSNPHDVNLSYGVIHSLANFGYSRAAMMIGKTGDLSSLDAPGGPVSYTVTVTNTGPIDITLDSLIDDVFGDLNNKGDCLLPQIISAASAYNCNFTGMVMGGAGETHINVVTARAYDSENNPLSAADYWAVSVNGVLPPVPAQSIPTISEIGKVLLYLLVLSAALAGYRRLSKR